MSNDCQSHRPGGAADTFQIMVFLGGGEMGGNVRVAETAQSKLNVGHKINRQES